MKKEITNLIIWERVSFFSFMYIIIQKTFFKNSKILFFEESNIGRILINTTNKLTNNNFIEQLQMENISRVDQNGNSLRYSSEEITWQAAKVALLPFEEKFNAYPSESDLWLKTIQSWLVINFRSKTEFYLLLNNYIKENY
ncbi:MAG: hypothetical protein QF864_11085, partial [SAR202 cluster bacterium]|nr:hypothetical protein [SAR202 cluster bacterium]